MRAFQTLDLPRNLHEAGVRLYWTEGPDVEKQSHAFLLDALEVYTGCRYAEEDILRRPGEKPMLRDGTVQFSVTHSGGVWMVCMAREPVGLDLQRHKDRFSEKVAGRYFHETELARFTGEEEADRMTFFRLWCARESWAKFTGDGVSGMDRTYTTEASPVPLYELPFRTGYSLFLCTGAGQKTE